MGGLLQKSTISAGLFTLAVFCACTCGALSAPSAVTGAENLLHTKSFFSRLPPKTPFRCLSVIGSVCPKRPVPKGNMHGHLRVFFCVDVRAESAICLFACRVSLLTLPSSFWSSGSILFHPDRFCRPRCSTVSNPAPLWVCRGRVHARPRPDLWAGFILRSLPIRHFRLRHIPNSFPMDFQVRTRRILPLEVAPGPSRRGPSRSSPQTSGQQASRTGSATVHQAPQRVKTWNPLSAPCILNPQRARCLRGDGLLGTRRAGLLALPIGDTRGTSWRLTAVASGRDRRVPWVRPLRRGDIPLGTKRGEV